MNLAAVPVHIVHSGINWEQAITTTAAVVVAGIAVLGLLLKFGRPVFRWFAGDVIAQSQAVVTLNHQIEALNSSQIKQAEATGDLARETGNLAVAIGQLQGWARGMKV